MVTELHKGEHLHDSKIYEFVQKSVKDSANYLYERELHRLFLEKGEFGYKILLTIR